jgi:hypothetical protein
LDSSKSVDSVFNVCLEVTDVDGAMNKAMNVIQQSEDLLLAAMDVADAEGSARVAALRGPVGNVVHTLVNTKGEINNLSVLNVSSYLFLHVKLLYPSFHEEKSEL